MLLIKNAKIYDAIHREPFLGDILVKDGKIAEIGTNLSCEGEVYDAKRMNLYPGFVEAHSHIGLWEAGIGYEGQDVREPASPIEPEHRAIDAFCPDDLYVKESLEAGITTVCTGPGSSCVISGQFAAIKTKGIRVDDMVIDPMVAMKCAFGENVKGCFKGRGIDSRMTIAAKRRETLMKAREYDRKKRAAEEDPSVKAPELDFKMEAMLPVIRGEIPLKAHAHRAQDIFTAIRIAKEFGVKMTLEHVSDGHLIVDELAKEPYPVAVGPTMNGLTKYEVRNKNFETPGILARAGCKVSIITDAPVSRQKYLPLCAGMAIKAGMDPFDALQAITINPAHHIGVGDRIGSIEVGKDADFVIEDGLFYDPQSTVEAVFVNGELACGKQNG
ncbi:MAG: amidohydrolase family protein [Oscillospiraceae bacterium]|nr:amidohydrolase family protein [Oscillospiraceae bacterium]